MPNRLPVRTDEVNLFRPEPCFRNHGKRRFCIKFSQEEVHIADAVHRCGFRAEQRKYFLPYRRWEWLVFKRQQLHACALRNFHQRSVDSIYRRAGHHPHHPADGLLLLLHAVSLHSVSRR